ncbi:MAG: branched-chain amino acid ABC transporter permease [Halofilum sp. (in: g-proteobacteria)]|nr:branched-chain amino acid ABC transporter permease [Halofilum sp. (in: g-proteobacteria)]
MLLFLEQVLNGLQLGVMLFLLAAGLTLIFGIMGLINLAHGSLYMIGAYACASTLAFSGNFLLAVAAGMAAAGVAGLLIEAIVMRRLYDRGHLDQVLATFGLILFFNEFVRLVWGARPLFLDVPGWLGGNVEIIPGAGYPVYRLLIIGVGLAIALGMWWLVQRTRLGMLIRAGATDREMVAALGIDTRLLYAGVFVLGAVLAGLAGALAGPLFSVEVGMGEHILVQTFVVIVIGGIGSIRGALAGALLVGMVDTLGRAYLPTILRLFAEPATADGVGGALASMTIYLLMAAVLIFRPRGLLPAHGH